MLEPALLDLYQRTRYVAAMSPPCLRRVSKHQRPVSSIWASGNVEGSSASSLALEALEEGNCSAAKMTAMAWGVSANDTGGRRSPVPFPIVWPGLPLGQECLLVRHEGWCGHRIFVDPCTVVCYQLLLLLTRERGSPEKSEGRRASHSPEQLCPPRRARLVRAFRD